MSDTALLTLSAPDRRNRRKGIAAFAVAFVSAGIALAAVIVPMLTAGATAPPIVVQSGDGSVAGLDPATGDTSYRFLDAAISENGERLYHAQANDSGATVVAEVDPASGAVLDTTTVDGELEIRTVSPDGDAVALLAPRSVEGLYVPEPRETTSITVLWRDPARHDVFELDGNYEPEAFAADETALYLLEFWPPTEPDRYFVRRLDLDTGELADVYSPQVELQPEMRGRARAQAMAPDASFLYTLYTIDADSEPVHDVAVEGDTSRWAFIHVLSLDEDWSFCIFLPLPIGTGPESAISLAISPDGRTIHVVDTATATVAMVDTATLTVTRTVTVDRLSDGSTAHTASASDGTLYLASNFVVAALAPDLTTVTAAWSANSYNEPITDIELSADETQLRVALPGQVAIVDLRTATEIGTLVVPGSGDVTFLGPPGSSITQFPIECAC